MLGDASCAFDNFLINDNIVKNFGWVGKDIANDVGVGARVNGF